MRELLAITGSRARAGILFELLRESGGTRTAAELTRAAGVNGYAVRRELTRLMREGLVCRIERAPGRIRYQARPAFPGLPELRRFVRVTAGVAGEIRRALLEVDEHQLAWVHGRYAMSSYSTGVVALVALTERKRQVAQRLKELRTSHVIKPDLMSVAEWVTRLRKRELRARALRRAYRMLAHRRR